MKTIVSNLEEGKKRMKQQREEEIFINIGKKDKEFLCNINYYNKNLTTILGILFLLIILLIAAYYYHSSAVTYIYPILLLLVMMSAIFGHIYHRFLDESARYDGFLRNTRCIY